MTGKNIYFASDFHLGLDVPELDSLSREKLVVQWLDSIEADCAELFLVGDVFDYWFEYKEVVPKHFIRFLGKVCQMADKGIKIHLFTGNHDMWLFTYFQKEIGLSLYKKGIERSFFGKTCFIAHGDGLGPGDQVYKVIKSIFSNSLMQWCFHRLHPNFGIRLMKYISRRGRENDRPLHTIEVPEREWLVQFSRSYLKENRVDYFFFGHRHYPMKYPLEDNATFFYLGDWLTHFTYVKMDEYGPQLLKFQP